MSDSLGIAAAATQAFIQSLSLPSSRASTATALHASVCWSIHNSTTKALLQNVPSVDLEVGIRQFAKLFQLWEELKGCESTDTRTVILVLLTVMSSELALLDALPKTFLDERSQALSEYFVSLASKNVTESNQRGSICLSTVVGSDSEDAPLEIRVAGCHMVCVVILLHNMLARSKGPTLPSLQRRFEKLFNERSMIMYIRMLIAFLEQQPRLPLRQEESNSSTHVHRSAELILLMRRLDVLECFGIIVVLATALFHEVLDSSPSEAQPLIHTYETEVLSQRVEEEGGHALINAIRDLEHSGGRHSNNHVDSLVGGAAAILTTIPFVIAPLHNDQQFDEVHNHASFIVDAVEATCSPLILEARRGVDPIESSLYARSLACAKWCKAMNIVDRRQVHPFASHWAEVAPVLLRLIVQATSAKTAKVQRNSDGFSLDEDGVNETQNSADDVATRPSTQLKVPRSPLQNENSLKDFSLLDSSVIGNRLRDSSESLKSVLVLLHEAASHNERHVEVTRRLAEQLADRDRVIEHQNRELMSLRETSSSLRLQLQEESAAHASQVASFSSEVLRQQEQLAAQQTRIRGLVRQLKRFEQMSSVIRSMTTDISASCVQDSE